ncbi:hypothetical protein BJV74DRAFT_844129 [Russula compacta]|nr:hypothetical protein BJV74DRAFT_844129 [Russula compacta]
MVHWSTTIIRNLPPASSRQAQSNSRHSLRASPTDAAPSSHILWGGQDDVSKQHRFVPFPICSIATFQLYKYNKIIRHQWPCVRDSWPCSTPSTHARFHIHRPIIFRHPISGQLYPLFGRPLLFFFPSVIAGPTKRLPSQPIHQNTMLPIRISGFRILLFYNNSTIHHSRTELVSLFGYVSL